jgi:hypothetical protein
MINELGKQAASQLTSDEAMIERLSAAYAACFTNKRKFRKTSPKWRTDAHVMWNALKLEFFPYQAKPFSIMSNNMLDTEFNTLCMQFARKAYEASA